MSTCSCGQTYARAAVLIRPGPELQGNLENFFNFCTKTVVVTTMITSWL